LHRTSAAGGAIAIGWAMASPATATAHSLSGRVDTPLPLVAYVGGAVVAVGVSFAIVAVRDPGPPLEVRPLRTVTVPRPARLALRALGLGAWALIVAQLIVGGVGDADAASLFLWTLGWVGLAMVSAILGPVWPWLDPFTALYDLAAAALRRLGLRGRSPRDLPAPLGAWAAVAGLCFVVWLELVAKVAAGRQLAVVLLGYTVITLAAMAQYGRDAWRRRGETFSAWFRVLGRLAPFALAGDPEDGTVARRPLGSGLVSGPWRVEAVVLVAVGTGSIIYDGLSQTRPFYDLFGFPGVPLGTVLLAGFLGVLVAVVLGVGRRVGISAVGAGLLPVAMGYLVAHYLGALLVDAQRVLLVASDPFQLGWDLLGLGGWEPDASWLPTTLLWSIQVAAVVAGHVIGAWAGHAAARARERDGGVSGGPLAQLPLAVMMVALTSLTLWSLGQNLVFEAAG
jgi:hypothetical protein